MSPRQTYIAPRDPTERQIADLWESHLRTTRVGIHDGFADLGGNSLVAADLAQAIALHFGERSAVQDLLRLGTVAEQADLIRRIHAM